jgi:hypothetical protein
VYNVGLGDCIYVRVPDRKKDVHILIDCGNKFGSLDLLGERIAALKKELPDAGRGRKRLDLLVVSHPHEDHHKGFEEEFFKDLKIEHLWLSPAFNRQDPHGQGFHALQDAAQRALSGLSELALGEMKEQVSELLSLTKEEAIETLCHTLPEANGIQPLYVSADTPQSKLRIFQDKAIKLKVLGPMQDIDGYYLGGEGLPGTANELAPESLAAGYASVFSPSTAATIKTPRNISAQDFEGLRSQAGSNALALAELAGHAVNNLSVVLLLEWHGRRLLFPGDAEWNGADQGKVQKGRANGSWNVMWQERRKLLQQPLDFLKVGHHGSENATPWTAKKSRGQPHPINAILDALLPRPAKDGHPTAQAIVSTKRTTKWPSIPDASLLAEIGQRVANARTKYDDGTSSRSVAKGTAQPQRTDLEEQAAGAPVPCIEVSFPPR